MKKRIESIRIVEHVDDDPDLSYLGEYHDDHRAGAIDRQERGDHLRGEFRYFSPAMTGDETGNPESPELDYKRCEAYNRGEWWMIGIRAVAHVWISGTLQTIRSTGLWGIESDSGESYLAEVGKEQLDELTAILRDLGFSQSAIEKATPKRKAVSR